MARSAHSHFIPRALGASLLALGLASAAHAQSYGSGSAPAGYSGASGYSWLPYTQHGYVGINLGRADYSNSTCGIGGQSCDNPDISGSVYTGGLFNDWVGVELGYVNMGSASRAGGHTESQGVNLSLVGRAPIGAFTPFIKGGTTYGRTHVSADALSGVTTGTKSGWGRSYGAGLSYDLNPTSAVVLQWDRDAFRFPGAGRSDVDATTVGYVYKF